MIFHETVNNSNTDRETIFCGGGEGEPYTHTSIALKRLDAVATSGRSVQTGLISTHHHVVSIWVLECFAVP